MLLFCTTLPLREDTTRRDCVQLFAHWVCSSHYYPIDEIDIDQATQGEFEFRQDGFTFLITHYRDQRYQFSYPTSPSDVRGGKNKASEMRGILDVEKKI